MITHGSELYVSLWHPLRTFQPGPVWEQSEEWSFGQPPGAGHWQGRICRGMESLVPLQGLGMAEGSQVLWLPGPQPSGTCLSMKNHLSCRGPQIPLSLYRIPQHLMAWWASLGAHSCGHDDKWLSANDKAPTAFCKLSENWQ